MKKRLISYLTAIVLMTIFACGSDTSTEAAEAEVTDIAVEELINLDEEPMAKDSTAEISTLDIDNTPEPPKMSKEEQVAAEKRKEERKKNIQEQVSNSPFKTQKEAVEKFKELATAYLAGNNRWKEWDSNDPIFQSAKRNPEYAKIIKKLDDEMMAFDDEDE